VLNDTNFYGTQIAMEKSRQGGRPRPDGGRLSAHPRSTRLTDDIEDGLEKIASLRGDGLDRSALIRILLSAAVKSELVRLGVTDRGSIVTQPSNSPEAA
jgi:hypothetical protein